MAVTVEAEPGRQRGWEALAHPAGVRVAGGADPDLGLLIESCPGPLLVVADRCPAGLFAPGRPPRGWMPPELPEAQGRRLVELLAEGYSAFYASSPSAWTPTAPPPAGLTTREREVLELVSDGWSNPEIARFLDISVHTVKYHLARLLERLEAANRAELVRRAAELGLLRL